MKLFDREAIKDRISKRFGGSTTFLVNAILDEIEAALPKLLEQARVDLIELAAFKLIDIYEERKKAELEGKAPEPEPQPLVETELTFRRPPLDGDPDLSRGYHQSVEPIRVRWMSRGARVVACDRNVIRAFVAGEINIEECREYASGLGWVETNWDVYMTDVGTYQAYGPF